MGWSGSEQRTLGIVVISLFFAASSFSEPKLSLSMMTMNLTLTSASRSGESLLRRASTWMPVLSTISCADVGALPHGRSMPPVAIIIVFAAQRSCSKATYSVRQDLPKPGSALGCYGG